jgi:alpha-galactosidase
MLEVGNAGMTTTEYRSHFSLWCLLAAPLMAGNDLRSMTHETAEILTNSEVIAVDQDSLGIEGTRVRDDGDTEVWMKPLSDGSKAVILFNRGKKSARISVTGKEIDLPATAKVRDLWAHKDLAALGDSYSASVRAYDVVVLRVSP